MIEVFATNVTKKKDGVFLKRTLLKMHAGSEISFDLEDCDRVLRIKTKDPEKINVQEVLSCLRLQGFECKLLEDEYK